MKKVARKTVRVPRKKPTGRPKLPDRQRRDFRVMLSLTKSEYARLTSGAKKVDMHYSPYARSLIFSGRLGSLSPSR
jgi:hypothetical protein